VRAAERQADPQRIAAAVSVIFLLINGEVAIETARKALRQLRNRAAIESLLKLTHQRIQQTNDFHLSKLSVVSQDRSRLNGRL
jgi:hypothetical protein